MGDAHEPRRQGQQPRKGQQFDGRAPGRVAMFATTRNSGNLDFWEVVLPEEAQPIEVATLRGWCWTLPREKRSMQRWP